MELPHNASSSAAVLQCKLQAFQALRGLRRGSAVLGQYQAYSEQVRRELHKPDGFQSLTPTFAGGLGGRRGLQAASPGPSPLRGAFWEGGLPETADSDPRTRAAALCQLVIPI